jgi:hypothetical protein
MAARGGSNMVMVAPRLSADEIVGRGEEIYEKTLRQRYEPGNIGKFISIDITSHDYEIGDDHMETVNRLRSRVPSEAMVCTLKIGYPAVAVIGGSLRPNAE